MPSISVQLFTAFELAVLKQNFTQYPAIHTNYSLSAPFQTRKILIDLAISW